MASGSSRTTTSSAGWASMASQSAAVTSGVTVAPSGRAATALSSAWGSPVSGMDPPGDHASGGSPFAPLRVTSSTDGCSPARSAVPCPAVHRPGLRSHLPRQREELQLGEDPDQPFPIRLSQHQIGDIQLDGDIALDGDELLRQPGRVGLARATPRGCVWRRPRRRGPEWCRGLPYSASSFWAPFSPMPFTPGMLSEESPTSAR